MIKMQPEIGPYGRCASIALACVSCSTCHCLPSRFSNPNPHSPSRDPRQPLFLVNGMIATRGSRRPDTSRIEKNDAIVWRADPDHGAITPSEIRGLRGLPGPSSRPILWTCRPRIDPTAACFRFLGALVQTANLPHWEGSSGTFGNLISGVPIVGWGSVTARGWGLAFWSWDWNWTTWTRNGDVVEGRRFS